MPFQLPYRPRNNHKDQKAPTLRESLGEIETELSGCYGQTNPEGRAQLVRCLIMDLVAIVICGVGIA